MKRQWNTCGCFYGKEFTGLCHSSIGTRRSGSWIGDAAEEYFPSYAKIEEYRRWIDTAEVGDQFFWLTSVYTERIA